jgi:hypothetical protein
MNRNTQFDWANMVQSARIRGVLAPVVTAERKKEKGRRAVSAQVRRKKEKVSDCGYRKAECGKKEKRK